jgi:hypothetical protein
MDTEQADHPRESPATGDQTLRNEMKSASKLKVLGWVLSRPWVGPSISLIVLFVGLINFWYNKAGYDRQTERWQSEEDAKVQFQLHIQPSLTADGYRPAYIQLYFPPTSPMRLERVLFADPVDAVAKADPKIARWDGANHALEIDHGVGPSSTGPLITIELFLRTKQTPRDQNSVIEIKADVSELSGEMRHLQRETRAAVPSDARTAP